MITYSFQDQDKPMTQENLVQHMPRTSSILLPNHSSKFKTCLKWKQTHRHTHAHTSMWTCTSHWFWSLLFSFLISVSKATWLLSLPRVMSLPISISPPLPMLSLYYELSIYLKSHHSFCTYIYLHAWRCMATRLGPQSSSCPN